MTFLVVLGLALATSWTYCLITTRADLRRPNAVGSCDVRPGAVCRA